MERVESSYQGIVNGRKTIPVYITNKITNDKVLIRARIYGVPDASSYKIRRVLKKKVFVAISSRQCISALNKLKYDMTLSDEFEVNYLLDRCWFEKIDGFKTFKFAKIETPRSAFDFSHPWILMAGAEVEIEFVVGLE